MGWHFYRPDVDPTMGTSLPANPVDGQEFTLVDSVSAPTYTWKLRYVAAKASNKWVFVGGSPQTHAVTALESAQGSTAMDLATDGPTLTVPVTGEYLVRFSAQIYGDSAVSMYTHLYINGSQVKYAFNTIGGNGYGLCVALDYPGSLTAGWVVKMRYGENGNVNSTWFQRVLTITPVAIGG